MVAINKNILHGVLMTVLGFAATVSLASCVSEQYADDQDDGLVTREFDASFAGEETITALGNGGKVQWSVGDRVLYYSAAGGDVKSVSVSEDGASTHFSLKTAPTDGFVTAVYGAESLSSPASGSVVLDGIVLPEQSGLFDDAHVSIAYTEDIASEKLLFYNLTSLLSFRLQRSDIAYVLFKPASPVPSGSARVSFSDGRPDISGLTQTGNNINSIKVSTSSGAGEYFISMFPGTVSGGFEMEFYDYSNNLLGTAQSSKTLNLKVSTILNLGLLDDRISTPEQHGGGTKSGLYLGIIGFNDNLYRMDIERLDASSKTRFDSFIDGLTTKNGTILYYSVDQSLRALQKAQYPDNLYNVSLVTFTDGLDMGSAMLIDNYSTDEECLESLQGRLSTSRVAGLPITAYSVGLRGNDVQTSAQYNMFLANLHKLAYPESNSYEASNMSSVNARFQEIAEKISQTTSTTKYNFEITIPGKASGTVWRFTLDGASSAESSQMYIEGTFNLSTRALTNVSYHGLTCSSGSTIQGTVNGIHVTYSFSDIIPDGSKTLSKDKVWTWWYTSNFWQGNTEFDKENDVKISVTYTQQSVVVLLDLDCSKSLDNQFSTLKSYAKSFIATLYNASIDPYEVTGVSLDKSTLSLKVGGSASLTATVSPSTAADKSVRWSSSRPSVASVNQSGKVTGEGAGIATITATTNDGGYTASCAVTVSEAPKLEAVDLGLPSGTKWATFNVGASKPEDYGDYFAWGETEPKSNYSWSTYKFELGTGYQGPFSKYVTKSSYGTVDNKTVLDPEDDAAHVNWGGSWRMPTLEECDELINKCTWTWTTQNGVNGRLVTGPNGKSIFLPAAGYRYGASLYDAGSDGNCWSSSLSTGGPDEAWCVDFYSGRVTRGNYGRCRGQSVRPVTE
ncbi:MAG: Ig-like domain-containing protein [Bacteroidales bacterium]|nr:Ig-like domain-containing protein [Bacteroidales bacterium]